MPTAVSVLLVGRALQGLAAAFAVPSVGSSDAIAMIDDAMANSAKPNIATRRAPNRSAAAPPITMQAAETTR